jgi:hypothetical protein
MVQHLIRSVGKLDPLRNRRNLFVRTLDSSLHDLILVILVDVRGRRMIVIATMIIVSGIPVVQDQNLRN